MKRLGPPSKDERDIARAVLRYYVKQANQLANTTGQEQPSTWAEALATVIDLLKGDPVQTMNEYLEEWKEGR